MAYHLKELRYLKQKRPSQFSIKIYEDQVQSKQGHMMLHAPPARRPPISLIITGLWIEWKFNTHRSGSHRFVLKSFILLHLYRMCYHIYLAQWNTHMNGHSIKNVEPSHQLKEIISLLRWQLPEEGNPDQSMIHQLMVFSKSFIGGI